MKGFHVSASGAIQGHHGPLVLNLNSQNLQIKTKNVLENGWSIGTQICLLLEAFECNTTPDWLNHAV